MNAIKLTIFVFGCLLFSSCNAGEKINKIVMGNQSLIIDEDGLIRKKREALDGSGKAASEIANYYNYVKLDYDKTLYWLQIACENGDVESMHSYWVIASRSNDEDERRRGIFWLKQAAAKGDESSQEQLKSKK